MIWQARNFARAIVRTNLIITKTFLEAVIDRLGPISPPESNSPSPNAESPPEESASSEKAVSRPRASRRRRKTPPKQG